MYTQTANLELVRAFLAERDEPCPKCGYNLRGAMGSCPECGRRCELAIRHETGVLRLAMVLAATVLAIGVLKWGWEVVSYVQLLMKMRRWPSNSTFNLVHLGALLAVFVAGPLLAWSLRGKPGRVARFLVIYALGAVGATMLVNLALQLWIHWALSKLFQ